jgi:hypothetical protein
MIRANIWDYMNENNVVNTYITCIHPENILNTFIFQQFMNTSIFVS